jgi:hypothetical protein
MPVVQATTTATATEWEMYKKILSMNSQASTTAMGLNKAENGACSTITLKDFKTPTHSPSSSSILQTENDENAPSNFPLESGNASATNGSDKVIYEYESGPYERSLASTIHTSSTSPPAPLPPSLLHPPLQHSPSPALKIIENEDYVASEHQQHSLYAGYSTTHKSIHHMTTAVAHYRDIMVDENLENKQQNFVNEEDDVWRPW